jgi:hypothetical protein
VLITNDKTTTVLSLQDFKYTASYVSLILRMEIIKDKNGLL